MSHEQLFKLFELVNTLTEDELGKLVSALTGDTAAAAEAWYCPDMWPAHGCRLLLVNRLNSMAGVLYYRAGYLACRIRLMDHMR